MSQTVDAFLRSWPTEPWILISLVVTAGIYLRGWIGLQRRDPDRWTACQLAAFLGGLTAILLALASPIEPFALLFLQVHMVQHVLLMMVAPPLLWLGAPFFPMLRGLPEPIRTYWFGPLVRSRSFRRLLIWLTHPKVALPLLICASWGWHLPAAYELALRSSGWHYLQHVSFFAAGLLFWYPVVRPYPSRPGWSLWLMLPFLILADVQNTVLSALLTFSDRLLYPYYSEVPRIGGLSALDDQSVAGLIMWLPGSLAYLLPLFVIGIRLLMGETGVARRKGRAYPRGSGAPGVLPGALALPILGQPRRVDSVAFDILRVPALGRFLRWRHSRLSLQGPLMLIAGVIVYDGLSGPPVGAMNLAGVLPWIHWRGLVVLGLLAAGNVFCMACPFMLPRTLARHWRQATIAWPHWLHNKWLSVLLLICFLWAYEAFALWDSPWWTAWIIVIYFAAAFVVDSFFQGASFCKYVCPIGQFNFVQSLISPLEVKVREPVVCTSCETKDCIRGGDNIPGCELHLYQPRKASNMDCTFCLDCIHACPHQNIGILAVTPGRELWHDPRRSGIGQLSQRIDIAALCVVLVFGAFVNAAGMTGPVVTWQNQILVACGLRSPLVATTAFYLTALIAVPLLLVGGAAVVSRRWGRLPQTLAKVATRYSYALIPLGFSMWLAHYSFHILTSYATVVPTTQRFAAGLGWTFLGSPKWSCACCVPPARWLTLFEILSLDVGLLLSLYTGYRIAGSQEQGLLRGLKILVPWAALMVLLFAVGIWIVFQPMQMRGTMPMPG
jgi:cytochrome c oxidase assembly factor CtaG/polyferredoxin